MPTPRASTNVPGNRRNPSARAGQVDNWLGVFTIAGTSPNVVDRLHAEILKAVRAPEVADRIVQQALDISTSRPAEDGAFFRSEVAKFAKIVKTAGIEPQ